jgi:hypothetical protein
MEDTIMKDDKLALSKKYDIKWIKSDRFERKGGFTLNGSAKDIFPLLCPVLEYAWLPGWKCRMAYSDSGAAENNCVFFTREAPGKTALWTCVAYEPPAFIEYLVTSGRDVVMRLSVRLAETGRGRTEVDWRMLFTAFSCIGRTLLRRRFTEAAFDKMMSDRERELNWYLGHGTMIGKE